MLTGKLSKKLIVMVIVALFSIMVGCNNEEPVNTDMTATDVMQGSSEYSVEHTLRGVNPMFTTQLSSCSVDILDVTMDKSSKRMTITLNAYYNSSIPVERTLILQFYEQGTERLGYTSTLVDMSGVLKWEFDFAVSNDEQDNFWVTERTGSDCMTIERSIDENSFSEKYTINGNSRVFHFNTSDISHITLLHERMLEVDKKDVAINKLALSTDLDREIVQTLHDFHVFYEKDNTLHDNPDGFLVADLLTSDELATWITNEYPQIVPDTTVVIGRWGILCQLADICTAIKCPEGANPLCVPCAAFSLTCAVMDLFNLW